MYRIRVVEQDKYGYRSDNIVILTVLIVLTYTVLHKICSNLGKRAYSHTASPSTGIRCLRRVR